MKWIDVKDKFPPEYDYVLVFSNEAPNCISIARHDGHSWDMLSNESQSNAVMHVDKAWYMEKNEITHWMPLPKEPDNEMD